MQVFVLFVMISGCYSTALAQSRTRNFTHGHYASNVNVSLCNETEVVEFQNLLVTNESIFVGATNAILQFHYDLLFREMFQVGPADDDVSCLSPLFCRGEIFNDRICSGEVRCTNNYNTLLLTYRNRLLACGTLYETCDLLMLNNITARYGSKNELQCPSEGITSKKILLARRDRSLPVVAAVYLNNTSSDNDLLYLGRSPEQLKTLIAPSLVNTYFTLVDDVSLYVTEQNPEVTAIYHLAWTDDQYAYVLWTNKTNNQLKLSRYCNTIVSHLSRSVVEKGDIFGIVEGVRTYTEITLQCDSNPNSTNDFVSAKVAFDNLYILYHNNNSLLAICSAAVSSLNKEFNFIRFDCWNTTGENKFAEILPRTGPVRNTCSKVDDFTSEWATCGYPEIQRAFTPAVQGIRSFNMTTELNLQLSNENATSFTISKLNGLFTSFIGTSMGSVKKVALNSSANGFAESITTDQRSPVIDCVVSEENNEKLYALTKNALFIGNVSNCNQYETCDECILSKDVYCGWCVLENRCTKKTECVAADTRNRWISPLSDKKECPKINISEPNAISFTQQSKSVAITLAGVQLDRSLEYTCRFSVNGNYSGFQSTAFENVTSGSANEGVCFYQRNTNDIIPTNSDHQNVTIEIVYEQNAVARGVIQVFSCEQVRELNPFTVCSSCALSKWNCSWCTDSATCALNPTCNNIVHSKNDNDCPKVTNISGGASARSVGQSQTFLLLAKGLRQPFEGYQCRFNFCDQSNSVKPIHINETSAECAIQSNELTCTANLSNITVLLVREKSYTIDVELEQVTRKIFNCSASARSCGTCIAFRNDQSNFFGQCGWCDSRCVAKSLCSSQFIENITGCGNASISSISPLDGPREGGTSITITGMNLGINIADIRKVAIGSITCSLEGLETLYVPSTTIVCRTESACQSENTCETIEGRVTVYTVYGFSASSQQVFQYKKVDTDRFYPKQILNQSSITINGTNLNVGNSATLQIISSDNNDTVKCRNRSSSSIVCKLPATKAKEFKLTLNLDGYNHTFDEMLEIVPVPKFLKRRTEPLRVFMGAGRNITLRLTNSTGVVTADLRIGKYRRACSKNASSFYFCEIPPLKTVESLSSLRKKRQTNLSPSEMSFVASLWLNDVHPLRIGRVVYVENPSEIRGSSLCQNSDVVNSTVSVLIYGNRFKPDETFTGAEYNVILIVGKPEERFEIFCNVRLIESESILCNVLAEDFDRYRYDNIQIIIFFGSFTRTLDQQCPGDILLITVIPIAVVVGLLLLLIFALCIWQKRKGRQQQENRRLILSKLDDLENKTRETARNAYYELQLGYMDNLAGNISHRIIYLAPEQYFTQTLFNLSRGHPVLDEKALENQPQKRIKAIHDWTSLLKKRDFLMIFIRTLEEQKKFTVQEKGNVASLLTVCLFSDMPYFTSIMFDLMTELIQKHVQKNPKLLLRRSESVVEKMVSHWLSITLYDECIMENSGEPIFLLAKAVHYLVSSGPCDVIANKSLNSLNESTLLGSEVSFSTKVLLASVQEPASDVITEPVEVSVVDVDTITQVKAKIIEAVYKDRPFSECPKPDDLDFEMLSGETSKEGIVLSDVDSTSVKEGNCTKINSIKHYNIPEKARVVLRPVGVLSPDPCSGNFRKFVTHENDLRFGQIQEEANTSPTSSVRSPLLSEGKLQMYHLIHPKEEETSNGHVDLENGGGKNTDAVLEDLIKRPMQEIYLTRMVRAKTTLQDYVDKVFKSILSPDTIPRPVRYLFHFLDREAARHRINDNEVIHIWKTNSLLLRYWVNVLKNPEFIFDINKTIIVDSCLNVITQAFMDACTTTTRKLGYDSPSNKLLYAKESQQYKKMVNEFFEKAAHTPWINDEDMNDVLTKTSQTYAEKFNHDVASQQLYQYLFKYKEQVIAAVKNNEHEDLASEIENLMAKMDDRNTQTETTVV